MRQSRLSLSVRKRHEHGGTGTIFTRDIIIMRDGGYTQVQARWGHREMS